MLEKVLCIDQQHVGFCGEFFRASVERRQVIAAYLALISPADDTLAEVGQFLSRSKHNAILREAYGQVLAGHRGALRRAGPVVHDERFYSLLYELLLEPPHDEIRRTIARLTSLDRKKLLILRMLPTSICRANVVEAIRDVSEANDIAAAFNLLISLDVEEDGLTAAIRGVRSTKDFAKLWQRWVLKVRSPYQHPVPSNVQYHAVTTAGELHSLAHKFRNCARRYLSTFLQGSDAFAVFEYENKQAVVHLRRDGDRWQLEGTFGPRNSRPPAGLELALQRHLMQYGVKVRQFEREKQTEWDSLRRVMEGDFDFEW